jgi:penicillin-binding protein 1A
MAKKPRNKSKPAAQPKPKPEPAPRGWIGRTVKWAVIGAIWITLGLGALIAWYAWDLPDISRLETPSRRPSVKLVTADGALLARYGDLHGGWVKFDDFPPHLIQAVAAIEDRRYFEHRGVDPWAILRAAIANVRAGTIRQGGSTISQQLAKNLFLTPDRTLRRKVQEALAALWLEAKFTKEQIFAIYANRVYLGAGTYGMEAASRRYFGKSVRQVTLLESAVLAGLLKAPSRYSPARDAKAATDRGRQVLRAMQDAGFLTEKDAARAGGERLKLVRATGSGARYFADWALERAAGYIGRTNRDLVVVTTLNSRLQRLAEQKLRNVMASVKNSSKVGEAALVTMTQDGAVRAMVGGRSYARSQFNRATQALRQPGSAFKLFVYLAALEAGMNPGDTVADAPIRIGGWRPRNYDGKFHGTVTLGEAFANSINTVAVRVSERVGRGNVIAAARRLGITSKLVSHPSVALGVGEVTLLELTASYAAVAGGGYAAWPHGITEIRDSSGTVLFRRSGSGGGEVLSKNHARALDGMLRGVIANGTGRAAWPGRSAAGKTGTSQDFRDAWFIGYAGDLVTGVWVGNDDFTPMKRITGGGLPAQMWRAFMADALKS